MKNILIIFTSLFFIVCFTACEESGIIDRSVDVEGGAKISYVNLSSGSPEVNLYFDGVRVTSARSQTANVLRGIPYRSSYPGVVTATVAATTMPVPSNVGIEYFLQEPGTYTITVQDTAYRSGFTTLCTSDQTFADDKFYSIYTMNLSTAMEMIVVEDDIYEFLDTLNTRIRVVNAVSGVAGDEIDVWLWHQPATGKIAIPPYKLVSNLDFKGVTAYIDTINGGNYKWIATVAGAEPTANTPPAILEGNAWTLTFAAADVVYARASTSATIGSQYSLLVFGEKAGAGVKAPYSGLFRNRYK